MKDKIKKFEDEKKSKNIEGENRKGVFSLSYRSDVITFYKYIFINIFLLFFIFIEHFLLMSVGKGFERYKDREILIEILEQTLEQVILYFDYILIISITLIVAAITIASVYINKKENDNISFKDESLLFVVKSFLIIATTLILSQIFASFIFLLLYESINKDCDLHVTKVTLSLMSILSFILYSIFILIIPETIKIIIGKKAFKREELLYFKEKKQEIERIEEEIKSKKICNNFQSYMKFFVKEIEEMFKKCNLKGFNSKKIYKCLLFYVFLLFVCSVSISIIYSFFDKNISMYSNIFICFLVLIIYGIIPVYLYYKQKGEIFSKRLTYFLFRIVTWIIQLLILFTVFRSWCIYDISKKITIIILIILVSFGRIDCSRISFKELCIGNTLLKLDEQKKILNEKINNIKNEKD